MTPMDWLCMLFWVPALPLIWWRINTMMNKRAERRKRHERFNQNR